MNTKLIGQIRIKKNGVCTILIWMETYILQMHIVTRGMIFIFHPKRSGHKRLTLLGRNA